jgi:hypothetical protein
MSLTFNLTFVCCFVIHISDLKIPGTKIFNSQHGNGWTYSICSENNNELTDSLLSINSSTGAVYLDQDIQCDKYDNPLFYSVISKRSSSLDTSFNITITPLKVVLEGHKS